MWCYVNASSPKIWSLTRIVSSSTSPSGITKLTCLVTSCRRPSSCGEAPAENPGPITQASRFRYATAFMPKRSIFCSTHSVDPTCIHLTSSLVFCSPPFVHNGSTFGFHAVWASTVGTDYLNILRKHGQHSGYLSHIGCKYKLLLLRFFCLNCPIYWDPLFMLMWLCFQWYFTGWEIYLINATATKVLNQCAWHYLVPNTIQYKHTDD